MMKMLMSINRVTTNCAEYDDAAMNQDPLPRPKAWNAQHTQAGVLHFLLNVQTLTFLNWRIKLNSSQISGAPIPTGPGPLPDYHHLHRRGCKIFCSGHTYYRGAHSHIRTRNHHKKTKTPQQGRYPTYLTHNHNPLPSPLPPKPQPLKLPGGFWSITWVFPRGHTEPIDFKVLWKRVFFEMFDRGCSSVPIAEFSVQDGCVFSAWDGGNSVYNTRYIDGSLYQIDILYAIPWDGVLCPKMEVFVN